MDFFQRQAAARAQSRWLIGALVLAILLVVAALDVVVVGVVSYGEDLAADDRAALLVVSTLFWLAVILGASAFKSLALRGGGGVVARSLGGVRVERSAADPLRRRLLNVVEEMSIASGVAVPEVYVLENESAINAFAAGDSPANAAVAVTEGALQRLNREQLQGVVAHEYSHILNGDMRLNLRLMGWLFGLLVIGLAGRFILRHAPRGRRNKGAGLIILIALAMFVLGYLGLFLGRVIQAAVCRHREWLADASAVQFTRNPEGLKGALLKIAGLPEQSRLIAGEGEQVAHMLFAVGMRRALATHPPLAERIRALDPGFDIAQMPRFAAAAIQQGHGLVEPLSQPALQPDTVVTLAPDQVAAQVGKPEDRHVAHARGLRRELRDVLAASRISWTAARTAVLGLLLSNDAAIRQQQLARIQEQGDEPLRNAVEQTAEALGSLAAMLRLPAVQLLFGTLRHAPQSEREQILALIEQVAAADGSTDIFEFCLGNLLAASLRDQLGGRAPSGRLTVKACASELGLVFTVLAQFGAQSPVTARQAYEKGMSRLLPHERPGMQSLEDWPARMAVALDRLVALHPLAKEMLVEALVLTIAHDGKLAVTESELLRTICARLQCPLPPVLPPPAGAPT